MVVGCRLSVIGCRLSGDNKGPKKVLQYLLKKLKKQLSYKKERLTIHNKFLIEFNKEKEEKIIKKKKSYKKID